MVQSFEQFITDHKDEITALQVLYSRPYKQRLKFEAVKELADAIEKPPYLWNESQLWNAYAALEKSKVKGASGKRILTDLVSLVRFAIHQDNELIPFPEGLTPTSSRGSASRRKRQEVHRGTTSLARDDPRPFAANLVVEPATSSTHRLRNKVGSAKCISCFQRAFRP